MLGSLRHVLGQQSVDSLASVLTAAQATCGDRRLSRIQKLCNHFSISRRLRTSENAADAEGIPRSASGNPNSTNSEILSARNLHNLAPLYSINPKT